MYTKQMYLDSMRKEVATLKHLYTKLKPEMLEYRPTPGQRSMKELIASLPINVYMMAEALRVGSFDIFKNEAAGVKEAALQNFDATLDKELARLVALVEKQSDADLAKQVQPPMGPPITFASALVDFTLKFMAAYRMQFFLYLKSCGRTELTTANVWGGMDAPPKQ